MIDLHCHILPGVDDGAKTIEDSVAMAHVAVANGITHILCTPHHNNGSYKNPKNDVIRQVACLQTEFDNRSIPLTLFEGQEVRITGELLEEIDANNILFADLDDQYLLIEFPSSDVPAYSERMFYELLSRGITPIIVHPERNSIFMKDPNKLIPYLDMGVLTQLTAPSYVGIFGSTIQQAATTMLEHDMLHMMASDAHNTEKRTFVMAEAYKKMENEFGSEMVTRFKKVAKDIINGDKLTVPDCQEIEKKRFSLFK